eukprot:233926_1
MQTVDVVSWICPVVTVLYLIYQDQQQPKISLVDKATQTETTYEETYFKNENDNRLTLYNVESDNVETDRLIEEEKNINVDRAKQLSLIDAPNSNTIRNIIKEQYINRDINDESTESDISELSSPDKHEIEQRKQCLPTRKSNITLSTKALWNNSPLINKRETEMQKQMEYLSHNEKQLTQQQMNLFRFKSSEHWNEQQIIKGQFEMQEQMVHLIKTHKRKDSESTNDVVDQIK